MGKSYSGMIEKKKHKRDFRLYARYWHHLGFKLFGKKNLEQFSVDKTRRDYSCHVIDFYLTVRESDSSCENTVCNITLNKQIETC